MKHLPEKNPQKEEEVGEFPAPPSLSCSVPENICVDLDGDGVMEMSGSTEEGVERGRAAGSERGAGSLIEVGPQTEAGPQKAIGSPKEADQDRSVPQDSFSKLHPEQKTNGKNHKYDAKNYFQSQQYALEGLKLIFINERNFRIQLVFTVLVICLGFMLNVSHQDWVALALVIALVLVTEALNSVVEAICDTISKEYRINIKYAKDVSAGAVLLSAILSIVAGVIIFSPYIWDLTVLFIEANT